jgi:hypothetical protein
VAIEGGAGAAGDPAAQLRYRGGRPAGAAAAAPPPPRSDPAVTLQSLEMVKRISDNVYAILASDNVSKLFDTMNVIQSPGKVTHIVKVCVCVCVCVCACSDAVGGWFGPGDDHTLRTHV